MSGGRVPRLLGTRLPSRPLCVAWPAVFPAKASMTASLMCAAAACGRPMANWRRMDAVKHVGVEDGRQSNVAGGGRAARGGFVARFRPQSGRVYTTSRSTCGGGHLATLSCRWRCPSLATRTSFSRRLVVGDSEREARRGVESTVLRTVHRTIPTVLYTTISPGSSAKSTSSLFTNEVILQRLLFGLK